MGRVLAHVSSVDKPLFNVSAVYMSSSVDGEYVLWVATREGLIAFGLSSGRPLVLLDLPFSMLSAPHFSLSHGGGLPEARLLRGQDRLGRHAFRRGDFSLSRIVSLAGNATHLFALVVAEDQPPVVLSAPFLELFEGTSAKEL